MELALTVFASAFVLLEKLTGHARLLDVSPNELSKVLLFLFLFFEFLLNFLQL